MARKVMVLRRDDSCSGCGAGVPAGSRAQWDSSAKAVTCLPCVEQDTESDEPSPETDAPEPIDLGRPGASARREHQRRQAKREQRLDEKWGTGRLGRIAKYLSDDPQSTKAWAVGARGEELLAGILDERLGNRAVLLHDRRIPRSRANIDHIAVAASGVWVIDAKRYKGKVERRDVGRFFRADMRLYVGGRDRSEALAGMDRQLDAVHGALDDAEVPIRCALTFVGAEWPTLFRKPFRLDGVWVCWPNKLADLIDQDGPLDDAAIEHTARRLAERLPAN